MRLTKHQIMVSAAGLTSAFHCKFQIHLVTYNRPHRILKTHVSAQHFTLRLLVFPRISKSGMGGRALSYQLRVWFQETNALSESLPSKE